jgi:hypothetical protein
MNVDVFFEIEDAKVYNQSTMSCEYCECQGVPPHWVRGKASYLDWQPPKKERGVVEERGVKSKGSGETYIPFEFVNAERGFAEVAILCLGERPHIHGLFADYLDLSGDSVYSFNTTIVRVYPSKNDKQRIPCPYVPRKVTTGNKVTEDDPTSAKQNDPSRIALQQHVIAFNQKQHRAADTICKAIAEIFIPEIKQIIVEYAVCIPVGPYLEHQIVPTFHLDAKYEKWPGEERDIMEDLSLLQSLFHVFEWHTENPRIGRWERPRATKEILD